VAGTSTRDYTKSVGVRLRRIRTQKGMSLQDVQEASAGRWKAAVVGAYERADRNVTVARLAELADFYGVPLAELLPHNGGGAARLEQRRKVVLDLEGLERMPEAERTPVERFATLIQVRRGDFNGRVLTVRENDLMALALLYEVPAEELDRKLTEWGVLTTP
jgi:transcriptional regulator with XRE-family HTH domain